MSPESFKYLLNLVGPRIHKQDTRFRKAISASERLCLTIHYLAYGNSQQSISFSYRIAGFSAVRENLENGLVFGKVRENLEKSGKTYKSQGIPENFVTSEKKVREFF